MKGQLSRPVKIKEVLPLTGNHLQDMAKILPPSATSSPSSISTVLSSSPRCKLTNIFFLPALSQKCPNKLFQFISSSPNPITTSHTYSSSFLLSYRYFSMEDDEDAEDYSFEEAVSLFNRGEYYRCHDVLEALWMKAEDPTRTLLHGILQCAVGFHHLFNQNHKGAMMELGEGVCKLRKMNFRSGPFHQFEQEISATLDFIYNTQMELAACAEDLCLAMDRSERSYQLLGGYAAGQHLYSLEDDPNNVTYIVFSPQKTHGSGIPPRVKLPILDAREDHLRAYGYEYQ